MTTKPTVTWFRQDHEHRNDWLRFGFMQMHKAGDIRYREFCYDARTEFGYDTAPTAVAQKANSLLHVSDGSRQVRCVVESNDSFFVMSDLVDHCDLYFCAGYNGGFFEERKIPDPLAWQTSQDVAVYQARGADLIARHGKSFDRVRPFVPIAPNLGRAKDISPSHQRLRNLRHKLHSSVSKTRDWAPEFADFTARYDYLLSLRSRDCLYDIVLLDSLWGWPRHRVRLHEALRQQLAQGRDIRARLNWVAPSEWDGSVHDSLDESNFPMVTGLGIDGYELMLAQSRLATFATGFHYGWRNILTLCLMIGVPVMADRIILEPWFGLEGFEIFWNDDADWSGVASTLDRLDVEKRARIAAKNTAAFDEVMRPSDVGRYVLTTALGA